MAAPTSTYRPFLSPLPYEAASPPRTERQQAEDQSVESPPLPLIAESPESARSAAVSGPGSLSELGEDGLALPIQPLTQEILGGRPTDIAKWLRYVSFYTEGPKRQALEKASEEEAWLQEATLLGEEHGSPVLQVIARAASQAVSALPPGEYKVVTFEGGKRLPCIELPASVPFASQLNLLLTGELTDELVSKLYQEVVATPSPSDFLEPLIKKLEKVLSTDLLEVFAPRLTRSLLEGKSLGGKALFALPEALRLALHRGVSYYGVEPLEAQLEERTLSFFPLETLQTLRGVATQRELRSYLEGVVKEAIKKQASTLQKRAFDRLAELSKSLPPLVADTLQLNIGDFGAEAKAMWFTFEGKEGGLCNVRIYTEVGVLLYRDVARSALDYDFFLRLFSYRTQACWRKGVTHTQEEVIDALLSSFPPPDRLSDLVSTTHWEPFLHFSEISRLPLFQMKKSVLQNATRDECLELLKEARALHTEGVIDEREVESIANQVEKLTLRSKEVKLPEKDLFIPAPLAAKLQGFISSTHKGWVTTLVTSVCGLESKEAITELLDAISPEPEKEIPVSFSGFWRRNLDFLSQLILGLSLSDFEKIFPKDIRDRSLFVHLRVALLVGRVALFILFPAKTLLLKGGHIATLLARRALDDFLHMAYPNAYAWIEEKKSQLLQGTSGLLMQGVSHFLLSEEERADLRNVVRKMRSEALKGGALSYEVKIPERKPPLFTAVRLAKNQGWVAPLVFPDFPLPAVREALTRETILPSLRASVSLLRAHRSSGGVRVYLSRNNILQVIRNLPLPLPEKEGALMWSFPSEEDRLEGMDLIANLAILLLLTFHFETPAESAEVQLHLFKLYAITDFLARRCPGAHLDGFSPNGMALASFTTTFNLPLVGEETHNELRQLKVYFGLDPDASYSPQEIVELAHRRNTLFYHENKNIVNDITELPDFRADFRYYSALLQKPEIRSKFPGIETLQFGDQIGLLYCEPARPKVVVAKQAKKTLKFWKEEASIKGLKYIHQIPFLSLKPEEWDELPHEDYSEIVELLEEMIASSVKWVKDLESTMPQLVASDEAIVYLPMSEEQEARVEELRRASLHAFNLITLLKSKNEAVVMPPLFTDPAFQEEWLVAPRKKLSDSYLRTPCFREEMALPRPFYFLRLINQLSHMAMHGKVGMCEISITPTDFSPTLKKADSSVREFLERVTAWLPQTWRPGLRHGGTEAHLYSKWRHLPGAFSTLGPSARQRNNQMGTLFTSTLASEVFYPSTSEISLNVPHSYLNDPHPRTQGEILQRAAPFRALKNRECEVMSGLSSIQLWWNNNEHACDYLTDTDRQALEMVFADRDEQVQRALAFFKVRPYLLELDGPFAGLLELLLFYDEALYKQLKRDPSFVTTLASFFKEMIPLIDLSWLNEEKKEIGRANFVRIGMLAQGEATLLDPASFDLFPNFTNLLLPGTEHSSLGALPYFFLDPSRASESQKREAVFTLLCLAEQGDLWSPFATAISKWKRTVAEVLDHDEETRARVLGALFQKKFPGSEVPHFTGFFPTFTAPSAQIQFHEPLRISIITQDNATEGALLEKLETEVFGGTAILLEPLPGIGFSVREKNIIVKVGEEADRFFFEKEGERYEWVQGIATQPGETLWLSEDKSELITLTKGEFTRLRNLRSDGTTERIPLLELPRHNLFALSWFYPLSQIEVEVGNETELRRLFFTPPQLSFTLREEELYSDTFPSFFIARNQKADSLKKFTRYLLLQDSHGHQKALIPKASLLSALASWGVHRATAVIPSQFSEKLLDAYLSVEPGNYYAYDLTPEGGLNTESSEALLFLLGHHLASAEISEAKEVLQKILSLGKTASLAPSFFQLANGLATLALLAPQGDLPPLALHLLALIEENRLLHQQEEAENSLPEKVLRFALMQGSYHRYLQSKRCDLNEFEELSLLESMLSLGEEILTSQFGVPKETPLATLVLLPEVKRRYLALKMALDLEDLSLDPTNLTTYINPLASESTLSIVHLFVSAQKDEGGRHLASLRALINLRGLSWDFLQNDDPLSTWEGAPLYFYEIKEEDLVHNFLSYYELSVSSYPNNPHFTARQKEWKKTLKYLQGSSFTSKRSNQIVLMLKMCAEGGLKPPCPLKELQAAVGQATLGNERKLKQLKDNFESFTFQARTIAEAESGRLGSYALRWIKGRTVGELASAAARLPALAYQRAAAAHPALHLVKGAYHVLTERNSRLSEKELIQKRFFPHDEEIADEVSLLLSLEDENINSRLDRVMSEPRVDEGLSALATHLQSEIAKLESSILAHVKALDPLELYSLEFESLLYALKERNDSAFLRLAPFTPTLLTKTKYDLLGYLVLKTRLNQVEKGLSLLPLDPAKAFKVLEQKRGYSFSHPFSFVSQTLLFERGSKMLVRQDQVSILLERSAPRIAVQGKTGLGKTSVVDPLEANHSIVVLPKALSKVCTSQLSRIMREAFQKQVTSFRITRDTSLEVAELKAIRRALSTVHSGVGALSAEKNDFLSLQLQFLEALDKAITNSEKANFQRLFQFQKTLAFLRKDGRALFDELQQALKRKEELNYPLGAKKKVEEEFVHLTLHVAYLLFAIPEVGIDTNTQDSLSFDTYTHRIKPLLAEKLSDYFDLAGSQKASFIHYLLGGPLPPFVQRSKRKEELSLAKGLLEKIVPKALEGKIYVSFGPSKDGSSLYARPYSGNNSPIEQAQIKNPFEAVFKTALNFLYDKLSETNSLTLFRTLVVRAREEAEERGLELDHTPTARTFASWCPGKTLSTFEVEREWHLISRHPAAALTFAKLFVIPQIHYFGENLKADSFAFASMFPTWKGISASLIPEGAYPSGTRVVEDRTVDEAYSRHLVETHTPVHPLSNIDPARVLEEILTTYFNSPDSKARAIIDSGALLHGIPSLEVAHRILERTPATIKGVVFFDLKGELVVLERGSFKPIPFALCRLKPNERVTYYSHKEIVGADIEQGPEAEAVQTLSWKSTFEELLQGSGRMRGFNPQGRQRILLVTPPGMGVSSAEEAIRYTKTNQESLYREENYLSARQKIINTIRECALDLLYEASSVSELCARFKNLRSIFIQTTEDRPSALYGSVDEQVNPLGALHELKEQQYRRLEPHLYPSSRKEELRANLQAIESAAYPPLVSANMGCDDLGIAQEVCQTQAQEREQRAERDQTADLQQDLEAHLKKEYGPRRFPLSLQPAKWRDDIDYFHDTSWLHFSEEESVTSNEEVHLYDVARSFAFSDDKLLESASYAIPLNFFWSNNHRSFTDSGETADPLTRYQKPITELLLVIERTEEGTLEYQMGAIDFHEVREWRSRMKRDREGERYQPNLQIALFSVGLNTLIDSGKNSELYAALKETTEFKVSCIQWRCLAGIPNFSKEPQFDERATKAFRLWLVENDTNSLKELFQRAHAVKGGGCYNGLHAKRGKAIFKGSDLDTFCSPSRKNPLIEALDTDSR